MTISRTPQPQDLIRLLTRAERLLGRRLAAILDTEGCTPEAWRVITLLSDGAGHHMTEIAEHAFLPPATLTKLLDHLVEENLVYRRIDEIDRRRIRAHLTPRGRRLHQRVSQRVEASMAALPAADGDHDLLEALLTRLVDSLEDREAGAARPPRRKHLDAAHTGAS
ncbi:MarR family winged helix-turn-helix transcriptional regulator [Dactylosporangium sp. CA-152071]|uniref:MarR family winged helix-turn-helix transcriptional regulator n=1 Tax=Dactylosporangium sp. CA-152071 TaxID=3239933 RepID=UPI003D94E62C